MQTFLPFADFNESARVLDNKRLQKQTVETYQILLQLCDLGPIKRDGETIGFEPRAPRFNKDGSQRVAGWGNHPMLRMWRGHELWLVDYQHACFDELLTRPLKSGGVRKITVRGLTDALINAARGYGQDFDPAPPEWLGREDVHRSHREALLWKAPEWYSQFGWDDQPRYDYVWPV